MTTDMHRFQISLREAQVEYLYQRADRDGTSVAEVIRQLVEREAAANKATLVADADSLWQIAGIGEDKQPLIDDTPVSHAVDLYLTNTKPRRRKTRTKAQ